MNIMENMENSCWWKCHFKNMFKISLNKELQQAYWRTYCLYVTSMFIASILPFDQICNCLSHRFHMQRALLNLINRILFHQKYKFNNKIVLPHEYYYISKSDCVIWKYHQHNKTDYLGLDGLRRLTQLTLAVFIFFPLYMNSDLKNELSGYISSIQHSCG